MPFYKATKDGWDGRQLIPRGKVFEFEGPQGSWMVKCDRSGKVAEGEKYIANHRPVRAGATQAAAPTRDQLRQQLRDLNIKFPGTAGAIDLAELLRKHKEGDDTEKIDPEDAKNRGGDENKNGTGNQDVL